jgi:hypothetical protein
MIHALLSSMLAGFQISIGVADGARAKARLAHRERASISDLVIKPKVLGNTGVKIGI